MLRPSEHDFFKQEQERLEASYLAGQTPQAQSGFARSADQWECFRRPVAKAVDRNGAFLDVGCANGLLMESVVGWCKADGQTVEAYGLDISKDLANLARHRLPHWQARIFVGNALFWEPPKRFDFVRSELVYVPEVRRREYVARLIDHFVAPRGKLILCSYGSTRPEGARVEPLAEELASWGVPVAGVEDVLSPESGLVVTRVVTINA